MHQVVAYKRLTTMEKYKQSATKFGHACLQDWSFTRGFNCKALTGKHLCFGIRWLLMGGGHTWRLDSIMNSHAQ